MSRVMWFDIVRGDPGLVGAAVDPHSSKGTRTMTDDSTRIPGSIDRADRSDGTVSARLRASAPASIPQAMPAVLPTATESVAVAFAGDGAGIGELTWGQREIWASMTRQGWLRMGGILPLAPGTAIQDVADELSYMMSRYQSMRMRLRFDESGRPTQEVFASGEISLEVYDADAETGPDTDADGKRGPQETAAAVEAKYLTATRDYDGEWPVRMGVVRCHSVLTHLVVMSCHLVSDGAGMQALTREVEAKVDTPVEGMQLLDLTRWQHSPAGEQQSAAALRHTEKLLRSIQPSPLRDSTDRREPRHWTGELISPALSLAVQAICERTRADSPAVLQALYAVALGRRAVLNPAVIRPLVSNRFRPGLAGVVCNLVQSGIFVLDAADVTVDEAVVRAQRVSRTAYKHAYFDPEQEKALFERIAQEQGPGAVTWGAHTWSLLNDRRTTQGPAPQAAEKITPEEVALLQARTTFRWSEKKGSSGEPLMLHIEDAPEGIMLIVSADTHYVSPADNEGLARDMEAIAIEALFDPAAPTLVPSSVRL